MSSRKCSGLEYFKLNKELIVDEGNISRNRTPNDIRRTTETQDEKVWSEARVGPVQQDGHGTISWYYFRVRHLSVRRQEKKTNWTVVEWTDVQEVGSMERSLRRRRRTRTNQSQASVCFYVQAFGNNEGSLVDGPTGPAPPVSTRCRGDDLES